MIDDPIQLREMTLEDVPFGMELSALAGWNQNQEDWKFFIETNPEGNYIASFHGTVAGTVTTIPYEEKFSWIGLALVHPDYRRRGIGRRLLNAAIYYAQPFGVIRLDATSEGRKLYRTLGFKDEALWERMVRLPNHVHTLSHPGILPLQKENISQILKLDISAFGASRKQLLAHLHTHFPDLSFCHISNDEIHGYCLGRKGRLYHQIGPVVATNIEIAKSLLNTYINTWKDYPVTIDTFTHNSEWITYLQQLGFNSRRTLYRMYLGESEPMGIRDHQFALAGPEYG